MDSAHIARFLQALAKSVRHSVGLSALIAAKLTQIRQEAVISTSIILTEESKDSHRKIPLLSQPLFGGKIKEVYKENSEQQQNSFVAHSAMSMKSKTQSLDFKIPKGAPPKKSKPTKRPPNPPKPHTRGDFRGDHSGSGSGRRGLRFPPLEEPPKVNTDVSFPLPLLQSNLPVSKTGPLCRKLGKNYRKSMGPFCHQKRLQNFVHFKASSFPNSDILPSIEHLSSGRRGPIATGSTGVLLSDFSGPEEKRETKTHNRFVQTEHLCGCSGVQNGNSGKSQTGDSNQQLFFFPRSDRCLSSCAHAQSISETPPILHLGSSIPIQSSPIQTNKKFLCLYSVDDCSSHSFEKEGNNCFHI